MRSRSSAVLAALASLALVAACTFKAETKSQVDKDSEGSDSAGGEVIEDATAPDLAGDGTPDPDSITPPDTATPDQVGPQCLSDAQCDDNDECTVDTCDGATGTCKFQAVPGCGVLDPCADAGGLCVQPTPVPEEILCPEGMASDGPDLCSDGKVCCLPVPCTEAGGTFDPMTGGGNCCPGLEVIPGAEVFSMGGDCLIDESIAFCSDCPNGVCDFLWENECNCPKDCPPTKPWPCEQEGGKCLDPGPDGACPFGEAPAPFPGGCPEQLLCCIALPPDTECAMKGGLCVPWTPDYGNCPEGTGPSGFACTTKNEVCCTQATDCVEAGGYVPVIPNAPKCCPGLSLIQPAQYDPQTGVCQSSVGASICAACGDGFCAKEWENLCNCELDCGGVLPPGECYGPLEPCPPGQYCQYPGGTCDLVGSSGVCAVIPQVCTGIYMPVCGCDGITYSNACAMAGAQVSLDHEGECGTEPGCLPLGGEFTDFDTEGKCCPGLVPSTACIWDETGGCACPNCPCYVCLYCGDGKCDPQYEHPCNCPEDCQK